MRKNTGWLATFSAGVIAAALMLDVSVRTASAADELIPCPSTIYANGWGNRHWVSQHGGGVNIPFDATSYTYKRGPASAGNAWYWPDPRTTTYQGWRWEWMDPGVRHVCRRIYFPPNYFDSYDITSIEGHALVIPDAHGPDPDEDWRDGTGYFGGGGETSQEECYEVWLVWRDWNNEIYAEEYVGDVCFQNGLMT